MRITKYGHACVALEKDGRRIVLDPGSLTELDATEGADAILITHQHFDHFAEQTVRAACERRPGTQVLTCEPVAAQRRAAGREGGVAVDQVGEVHRHQPSVSPSS